MSDPEDEASSDVAMLEQGFPIDMIGRSDAPSPSPGWGHPEANPLRDVREFMRSAELRYLRDDFGSGYREE